MRGDAPDGGPPIRERQNELDREIVASDGNRCALFMAIMPNCVVVKDGLQKPMHVLLLGCATINKCCRIAEGGAVDARVHAEVWRVSISGTTPLCL